MSNYSDAHGAAAAISLTLRNNPALAENLVKICGIASYNPADKTWTQLREAGIELSSYVGNLVASGQYSDLAGIDRTAVDWEALVVEEWHEV